MFLKSLSLKGFKSFADSTTLEMEPGVTVVVGPNGSGKSNVVDAIAWVLGAQAPSAVRSQRMDDVIFAGTAKRPALGRAEVSLCIDNSSGILPIEFAEVTITRTLFRDGESEYAMNGVPCRLLDIQELLSDSGVGRQQHVIVSQGQIDAVLNARPEDRRSIVEEAAGVLKYRRRREKAQRRLVATEENLTRVQDLLREVRRQLRPLERQAEAARRHGDLVAELTTLRRHLAGREIVALRGSLVAARDARRALDDQDRTLRDRLRELDEGITEAENSLAATGADDLGYRLARVEGLRERSRGLQAVLSERMAGLEREIESSVDQGVVETLEAEAARLRGELDDVVAVVEALEPDSVQVAEAERQIAQQRSLFERETGNADAAPMAEVGEARGRLAAAEAAIAALESSHAELDESLRSLDEAEQRLGRAEALLRRQATELTDDLESTSSERLQLASAARSADERLDQSERNLAGADAELGAWIARSEALAMALDEARARVGAEALEGVGGLRGTLLDLVEIEPGWESAFEAAAGQALEAMVVADAQSALAALGALRERELGGGVLTLGLVPAPPGGQGSLRRHVRSSEPGIEALLDLLVGAVEVVPDWRSGVSAASADPSRVYVSREGDRFAPDGWRVGLRGGVATGAALEEARSRVETVSADVDRLAKERDRARVDKQAAADALSEADGRIEELRRRVERVREEHGRVAGDLRAVTARLETVRSRIAETDRDLALRLDEHEALTSSLPELQASEAAALQRSRELDATRRRIDRDAAEIGARRTELEVRVAAMEERRQFLRTRLDELDSRLERYADERARAGQRREHIERRLRLARSLRAIATERGAVLEAELEDLRRQRQAQSDAARAATSRLEVLRAERSAKERELTSVREQAGRRDVEQAEAELKLETVVESLRGDLDCEPAAAVDTACPPLEGISPQARVRELERDLRIMGPVNPLALEEFEALSERHEFLSGQLDDVRGSRRELSKVIRAIDAEIVTVFSAAFADVAVNFEKLFETLFPGGVGRLRLTSPDNLLETGIEIEAKPSGKNVKKLSLLSGGERSLTALAFLFSVFRSRPSPFYVMDEVEAALDDVNLHRFLQLVQEFRDDAQLIIVSHQKRTMEAADCLYGITMQPGGSSKAISEKPGAGGPDEIDLRDRPGAATMEPAGSV